MIRLAAVVLMAVAGWSAFNHLVAYQIFRSVPGEEGLREALRWDPGGADYHFQLGLLLRDRLDGGDLEESRRHLERAVQLNPWAWPYWRELGQLYELTAGADAFAEGEPEGVRQEESAEPAAHEGAEGLAKAERAYLRLLELNPRNAADRWRMANFYLRRGRLKDAYPQLRTAVHRSPTYREPVLNLLIRLDQGRQGIERVWPEDAESRLALLRLLAARVDADRPLRESPEGVSEARSWSDREFLEWLWDDVLAHGAPAVREGWFYVSLLLRHEQTEEARREWIRLAEANGIRDPAYAGEGNRVWNGDFRLDPSGGPFDWTLRSSDAAQIRVTVGKGRPASRAADPRQARPASEGVGAEEGRPAARAVEVRFAGTENLRFAGLEQQVVVRPGTRYRFSFWAATDGITTDQGPYFELADAASGRLLFESAKLLGNTPWTQYAGELSVPEGTLMLRLTLRRAPSLRIDNRIAGRLHVAEISLEEDSG